MTTPANIRALARALHPQGSQLMRKDFVTMWKWKQSAGLITASTLLGIIYPIFGDGFGSIVPFINGLVIGSLGGTAISIIELSLYSGLKRRMMFLPFVILKSLTYTIVMTAVVFCVILVSRSLQFSMSIRETLHSELFRRFIVQEDFVIIIVYALVFAFAVIFTREINIRLGQGVLLSLITGRFRKPGVVKRIFLFIDLDSSVSKAEDLGDMAYHRMLNDFFYDITDCILMSKGTIYQYVGDEVVVTWPLSPKTRVESALEAFVSCAQKISRRRGWYVRRYGAAPAFKAAIHCGELVYGEIGRIKTDFVFHGDVINTTSRLERACSDRVEKLLISQAYFDLLPAEARQCFQQTEPLLLKGKMAPMMVYRLIPSGEDSQSPREKNETVLQR